MISFMAEIQFPQNIGGVRFHLIGIKGTGMAALAELLLRRGGAVTGSDREEQFYTDRILQQLGINYYESFSPRHIPEGTDFLIYSTAYDPGSNPEILEGKKRGIPLCTYTQALGAISRSVRSVGISGVHGKTTTTALAGTLAKALGIKAFVLAGAAVPSFGGGSILMEGEDLFIAETCEYQRHFLDFSPDVIVVTNIEADHLDYYKDLEDVQQAFFSYALSLPGGGKLLYCHDDWGARDLADRVSQKRNDIDCIPYGFSAPGAYRITGRYVAEEKNCFTLACSNGEFRLSIPGEHVALDGAAAFALHREVMGPDNFDALDPVIIQQGFSTFRGSSRRSELIGEARGVLMYDDYGHHPTEIVKTLAGFREFYPNRRLIVSFMSHTYSRTEALFDQFVNAFSDASILILHRIYASAREKRGNIDGETLFREVAKVHENVHYYAVPEEALDFLESTLEAGDLFLTLGAGDNWRLGKRLYDRLSVPSNQRNTTEWNTTERNTP